MSYLMRRDERESSLPDLFNRVFGSDFFGDFFEGDVPAINVKEKKKRYELEVSVPGFEKEDFEVKVEKNILTISGERTHQTEESEGEEKGRLLRKEFSSRSFCRSFTLPENIDTESIAVKYRNGILDIKLPKMEKAEEELVKRIEIK